MKSTTSTDAAAAYARQKRIDFAHELKDRKIVYLDTKYWALLRDVRLGRSKCDQTKALLSRLEEDVREGKCVCPLNSDVMFEVMKQSDAVTLTATVKMIDDLSLGACLIPWPDRIDMELFHYVESLRGDRELHDLFDLAWTKSAYVLGFTTPDEYSLSDWLNAQVQRDFIDHLWTQGLADILDEIGPEFVATKEDAFEDITPKLNAGKIEYFHQNKTFQDLYLSEVFGALGGCEDQLGDLARYMFTRDTELEAPLPSPSIPVGKLMAHAIFKAFHDNTIGQALPTIQIEAALHAAVRWDRNR
ncbi:MAG: hypothetical protein R3C59_10870 [Planctomycetaceae bacterium]